MVEDGHCKTNKLPLLTFTSLLATPFVPSQNSILDIDS